MGTMLSALWARVARGRLNDALALNDEAIALGAADPRLGSRESIIVCPYAWCLFMRGWTLSLLARFEEASAALDEAMRVAQQQEDIESQGWTHMAYVLLARYVGDTEAAIAHGEQGYEIAERIGSTFSRVWQTYFYGYAQLLAGNVGEAVTLIEGALELARAARTALEMEPMLIATLAEALLGTGDRSRAFQTANESVALALERGNDAVVPYSKRILAEAILASDAPGRFALARETLDKAVVAAEASGALAELPLIEQVRERASTLATGA
jgi:adenylate cyclase